MRGIYTNQQSFIGSVAINERWFAKTLLLLVIMFFSLVSTLIYAGGLFDFQMKLAERGNAEAQFKVGEMYETGFGVEQDNAEAFKWISKAANKGHETANFKLFYWDIEKNGVNDSNRTKLEDLKTKAKSGNPQAEYYLGKMHARGVGMKKDSDKAIEWLNKAVFVGVFAAESELILTRENKQREMLDKRRREQKKRAQHEAKKEVEKQAKLEQELEAKRQLELKKQQQEAAALTAQKESTDAVAKEQELKRQLEQQAADKAAREQAELLAEKKRQAQQKEALLKKLEAEKRTRKTQFESDPCSGKSARFLSTCR